jgi:ankyrin repeat protein
MASKNSLDRSNLLQSRKKPHIAPPLSPHEESTLIWKQGTGPASTGSVLVKLAQNGYTREAHKIIELSRTASLIGRDSDGGLPEFWDVMGKRRGQRGITRLMAVCITSGSLAPQRARTLIKDHNADINAIDDRGRTALHLAVGARDNNTELIRVLLQVDPEIVQVTDNQGYLPLHMACEKNAHFDVIKILIDQYPQGVMEKDRYRALPLIYSCKINAHLDVTKLLIDAYPEGVKKVDRYGYLPLHYAVENDAFDLITLLIDMYPEGLKTKENKGYLPLHMSCKNNISIGTIKLLLDVYPDGVKERDDQLSLSLPIHIACKHSSIDIIKLLIDIFPDGLYEEDRHQRPPL